MPQILLLEDEPAIADTLLYALRSEGFEVTHVTLARDALAAFAQQPPDLAILDVGVPDGNGFDVCRAIRKTSELPIVFLTARSEEIDRVLGLELGADDYVSKPFSPREVCARVKAILRRSASRETLAAGGGPAKGSPEQQARTLERGQLVMDQERHTCTWKGDPVTLTVTEFLILQALALRPGVVKSRNALMDAAYDDQVYVDDRTIDSHIKRLRKKFKMVDTDFDMIETLYGVGYRFREAA